MTVSYNKHVRRSRYERKSNFLPLFFLSHLLFSCQVHSLAGPGFLFSAPPLEDEASTRDPEFPFLSSS